ncbi:MAG: Holliday junction branch migration protein RuvA [Treponema sp.]|nr:Holliday junction branch migration protein RuvA [Treponema sp.]
MFNSLTGVITEKSAQKLCLDTHGIEWEIFSPDTSIQALPPVGEVGRVYTWMQHSDALMCLYGFSSASERILFLDLLKVDGIGPKAALKIMGAVSSSQLVKILDDGNLDALQKVPGVGKKTAAKMLLQLKGKLTLSEDGGGGSRSPQGAKSPYADVVGALANMGYDRRAAEQMVASLAQQMEGDAAFASMGQSQKEDALFRKALVEMAQ